MPGLIPTGTGGSILVTSKIETLIVEVARELFNDDESLKSGFTVKEWRALVRNAFGFALMKIDLDDPAEANAVIVLKLLKGKISEQSEQIHDREFAYGCSLFSNTDVQSFTIGPVFFEPRLSWLNRKGAEGNITKVARRRIEKVWSGKTTKKRKSSVDSWHEAGILEAVGSCPYVCSVRSSSRGMDAAEEKALTVARLALAAIALCWETPSKALAGFNLAYDRQVLYQKTLVFIPKKIPVAGSKLSHLPHGPHLKPGDWEKKVEKHKSYFSIVGEVLTYMLSSDGKVARPKLMNTLAQSLLWFHEGCRDGVTLMAIVKFSASMDSLACGRKASGILRVLEARVGMKSESPIRKNGPSVREAISQIYSDGRSRTIHGTNDKLGNDWTVTRGLAEQFARYCFLGCIDWMANNFTKDDPLELSK